MHDSHSHLCNEEDCHRKGLFPGWRKVKYVFGGYEVNSKNILGTCSKLLDLRCKIKFYFLATGKVEVTMLILLWKKCLCASKCRKRRFSGWLLLVSTVQWCQIEQLWVAFVYGIMGLGRWTEFRLVDREFLRFLNKVKITVYQNTFTFIRLGITLIFGTNVILLLWFDTS